MCCLGRSGGIAEPSLEPERPTTRVLKSESFGGRPVTAVVRCSEVVPFPSAACVRCEAADGCEANLGTDL
jgi:hypothetical protein